MDWHLDRLVLRFPFRHFLLPRLRFHHLDSVRRRRDWAGSDGSRLAPACQISQRIQGAIAVPVESD
jgi:hypothetical protein